MQRFVYISSIIIIIVSYHKQTCIFFIDLYVAAASLFLLLFLLLLFCLSWCCCFIITQQQAVTLCFEVRPLARALAEVGTSQENWTVNQKGAGLQLQLIYSCSCKVPLRRRRRSWTEFQLLEESERSCEDGGGPQRTETAPQLCKCPPSEAVSRRFLGTQTGSKQEALC